MMSPNAQYDTFHYATPPSSSSQPGVYPSHSRTPSISASSLSSSSYAGSAVDEADIEGDVPADDLVTLLTDRLIGAFDPIPLDRSVALQAQT